MGWKLAVALTSQNGKPLENAVSEIYGSKVSLAECDEVVERVLSPDDDSIAYAASSGEIAWVFDWEFTTSVLDEGYAGRSDARFLLLLSTSNLYGFAEYRNGTEIRRRAGASDDGIYVDSGTPHGIEREVLEGLAGPGQTDAAWAAWTDSERSFSSVSAGDTTYDEETHDTVAEEVVFALMQETAGFRFDFGSPKGDDFYGQPVLQISKPGLRKQRGLFHRVFGGSDNEQ